MMAEEANNSYNKMVHTEQVKLVCSSIDDGWISQQFLQQNGAHWTGKTGL